MVSLKRIVIGGLVLFLILTTLVSAPTDPFTVTITSITPDFAAPGETINVLNITINATGMGGNVTQIIVASSNTNDADIANVSLYLENGTSDVLLGYATFANGNITFNQSNADGGAGAGKLSRNGDYVNVSAGASITIYLKYTINLSAASGHTLDASIPKYAITIYYNGTDYIHLPATVEDPLGNTIIDATAPVVNLTSPENASTDLDGDVTLQCNATDAHSGVRNITLYHNISGQFVANATTEVSVNGQLVNFTLENLTNGTYAWNCYACDNVSNCNFSSENWTFTVPTIGINVTDATPEYAKAGDTIPILKLEFYNNQEADKIITQIRIRPNNTDKTDLSNISLYLETDSVGNLSSGDYSLGWTNVFSGNDIDIEFRDIYSNGASDAGALNNSNGVMIISHGTAKIYVVYTINASVIVSSDGHYVDAWIPPNAIVISSSGYAPSITNPAGNTTLDTIPPSIDFNASTTDTGNYSRDYITANVTASDAASNLSTITISLYNLTGLFDSFSCTTSPCNYTFAGLGEGTYYLNATANDTVGNVNMTGNKTIILDTTKPQVDFNTSTTQTGNWSQDYIYANVTANDSLSGLSRITIYLYNITALFNSTNCTTSQCPYNFTNLPQGRYYLNATANDTAGNENQTETRIIILDTTNPTVTINHPVSGGNYSGGITINATVADALSGVASVYYRLSNASGNVTGWLSMTNTSGFYNATLNTSEITSKFGDGNYTLTINASDNAGNVNTTENVTITLDNTPPTIGAPVFVSPTNQNTHIRINATFSDPTSGVASCSFNVTNATGLVIHGTMDNDAGISGTANGTTATALPDGRYNVTVTCTDNAGNANTSEPAELLVDTQGPQITLPSIADNGWLSQAVNITTKVEDSGAGIDNNTVFYMVFNSTGQNVTGWVQMANTTGAQFTAAWNTANHPDGLYNITITANDTLSNNKILLTANLTVDNTPPAFEFAAPTPANGTYVSGVRTINASVDATGVNGRYANSMSIEIWLDGALNKTCNSSNATTVDTCSISWDTAGDGWHNITIRAYEYDTGIFGVVNLTTRQVYVDNTEPNITNVALPECYYSRHYCKGVININANITDLGSGINNNTVYLHLWNSTYTNITQMRNISGIGFTVELNTSQFSEGEYHITIYANDSIDSGDDNTGNYTTTILIDNTNPQIHSLRSNDTDNVSRSNALLNFTVNAMDINIANVTLNATPMTQGTAGIWYLETTPSALGCASDGPCTLTATAADKAGNTNTTNYTLTVDDTNPAAVINSPATGSWQNGIIAINYTLHDSHNETCRWRYNDGVWNTAACGTGTFDFDTSLCSDGGVCKIQVWVNDSAGNENSTNITINVDNSAPTIILESPANGTSENTTNLVTFKYNVADAASGIVNCSLHVNGILNETDTSITQGVAQEFTKTLANGDYD